MNVETKLTGDGLVCIGLTADQRRRIAAALHSGRTVTATIEIERVALPDEFSWEGDTIMKREPSGACWTVARSPHLEHYPKIVCHNTCAVPFVVIDAFQKEGLI